MRTHAGLLSHAGFRYLALGLSWLLLWRVSALMEYAPYASLWFPPAGLSFAALLVLRWRALPVLMLCSVLVTFWTALMYGQSSSMHELLVSGVAFGLAHCLSYGLGAELVRYVARRSTVQSTPLVILSFLAAGAAASLLAALSEIAALRWSGMISVNDPGLWLPWWIGDMAGALVLTPLFISLLSWRYPQIKAWAGGLDFSAQVQGRRYYLIKLVLSVALVSVVMLSAARFPYREVAFAMFFLIIPQMWIVYTESPFRSALSLAIFSVTAALWVAALGLVEHALVYQFAICVIAASVCFGLAVPVLIARNNQLRDLAITDGLTQVATKEYFFERAAAELVHARSEGQPVALAILDVDHFKWINDGYGHLTGDQALIVLSHTLRALLRHDDLIGRFGGDEFTILLPNHGYQALNLTRRLERHLHRIEIPGTDDHFSVTFGVVGIKRDETLIQAFARADHMLLKAKQARKDNGADNRSGTNLHLVSDD